MNKVEIKGNLGNEPDVKELSGNKALIKFTIADNQYKKGSNGEMEQTGTVWWNCIFWAQSEYQKKAVMHVLNKKGKKLIVFGKLEENNYTNKDGVEVKNWQVNISGVHTDWKGSEPR